MDNVSIINDRQCCGCGACAIVCSAGGVSLCLDKNGYYKSCIIEDKCMHCGKCLDICPCKCDPEKVPEASFIGYCRSAEDVWKSSSGGIGYAIAKTYHEKGYAIIGASWSSDFRMVEHIIAADDTDLEKLRKSKYVQSYTPEAFSRIKDFDRVVVFGTPCQIAGLRKLYGHRDGLILVDFDCMGPAGLNLWHKAVDYYESIDGSGIKNIRMRDKKKSWMMYGTRVDYESQGLYWKDKFHDPFCILYHFGKTIQDACIKSCQFQNASLADIRIGDAWNDTNGFSREQIRNGLSIATPITERGNEVLNEISGMVNFYDARRRQNKPTSYVRNERIVECLNDPTKSIQDAVSIYNDVGGGERIRRKISYMLSANETI